MTTRVNKAGTVFRPVKAKSRGPSVAGSVSRQPSIIPDAAAPVEAAAHSEGAFQAAVLSRAMPPPPIATDELTVSPQFEMLSSASHYSVLQMQPPAPPLSSPAPPSISTAPRRAPAPPRLGNTLPSLVASHPRLPAPAASRRPMTAPPAPPPPVSVAITIPQRVPTLPVAPQTSPLASFDRNVLEESASDTMHVIPDTNANLITSSASSSTQHVINNQTRQDAPPANQNVRYLESSKSRRRSSTGNLITDHRSPEPTEPTPRKRKTSNKSNEGKEANGETANHRKRKTPSEDDSSNATRRRRARSPSLPRFDPGEGPGEELDPTVITMAALCSDTGQGRISSKAVEIQSNYASWKSQSKQRRAKMRELAELRKYGRITEDGETNETTANTNVASTSASACPTPSLSAEADDNPSNGFDYTQELPSNRFNVQVRIGPNGETIIDEESLVVDRQQEVDTSDYTHVVESDTSKFVNSGSYRKKCRGSRWSKEETELFYHALSQYGENYELLAFVLPGRDRTACKNKFKAEDRKDPSRITYYLNNRIPVDISALSRMTGKDFSGPCPEIRMPPPKEPPPPPSANTNEMEEPPQPSPLKVKKRSRSRSMMLIDDVQIIGSADMFDPTDH